MSTESAYPNAIAETSFNGKGEVKQHTSGIETLKKSSPFYALSKDLEGAKKTEAKSDNSPSVDDLIKSGQLDEWMARR